MTDDGSASHIELAMSLVLAYIERNRGAADTLDGIAQWWVGAGAAGIQPCTLRAALDRLVESGLLHARLLPSGETLWYVRAPRGGEDE
jgi:hypothetical protein